MYWPGDDRLFRSDNDYGGSDSDVEEPFFSKWYGGVLLFLLSPLLVIAFELLVALAILAGVCCLLADVYSRTKTKIKNAKPLHLFLVFVGILLAAASVLMVSCQHPSTPPPTPPPKPTGTSVRSSLPAPTDTTTSPRPPTPTSTTRSLSILVDDFRTQPYQGESVYYYNRLGGDRGAINDSILDWGHGQVTTTISSGNSWGGVWMSLNHPIREGLPIDLSAILPPQILPAYQSQITGVTVRIRRGTAGRTFKLELKDGNELRWKNEITLDGRSQVVSSDLPAMGNMNQLVWVLDHASPGDFVVLESVSFTATTRITDTATAAFVWSYGLLLNNWNPTTGLVRDKAKDASGEFDAIQATGSLAAATAAAEQLGFVTRTDAIQIVSQISDTLLLDLPRYHGLWPHWVEVLPTGAITIVENTEWSSVDTVIAAIGLLDAQSGLGMDTSGTEQMLQAIDWDDLVTTNGLSHGYSYSGDLFPYAWDVFGGESWLVELAYAGVTGQVAPITYPSSPTANGSGFIDELAWLFVLPPSGPDYWGTDWASYRSAAADSQIHYHPTHDPASCLPQLGLFGLSAAEVPSPASVPQEGIYQAFGAGGRFASANDGSALFGAPVVVPHYAAMIASLRPEEAIEMWDWLVLSGGFSPLNNVESLVFPASSSCDSDSMVWNQLKGSWNLSLQTLGWGRYLAERAGQVPLLWQATTKNPLLRQGHLLLVPNELSPTQAVTQQDRAAPTGSNVWTTTGLRGERIHALAIDPVTPTTLYAGTGSGVFRSTNGGGKWVNVGLTNAAVDVIAIDPVTPSTLYAVADGGTVRSTNSGGVWVNTGRIGYRVYSLAIDPVTPTTLYAGTDGGVFKSTDSGGNWSEVNAGLHPPPNDGLTGYRVTALAIAPAIPSTLYAGTSAYTYPGSWRYIRGGVFKSTDRARSWSLVTDDNASFVVLAIDPSAPTTLYEVIAGRGVFKSTDGGRNWSEANTGLTDNVISVLTIDPATSTTLYAGTPGDGVFKSTDGGGSWSAFSNGLTNTTVHALAIDPVTPNILYAGTDSGVFKSAYGNAPTPWTISRECEHPDEGTVGQMIWRSNASGLKVHGQFGTTTDAPWLAKPGYVTYNNLNIPQIDGLYLKLRYSKYSPSSVPILIYVDDEASPRATLYPLDQGDWNRFVWTEPILLGSVSGLHSIKFSTDGQQYGVADLDTFVLTAASPPVTPIAVCRPQPFETATQILESVIGVARQARPAQKAYCRRG